MSTMIVATVIMPRIFLLRVAVGLIVLVLVLVSVTVFRVRFTGLPGYQVHATLGATARLILDNFRMHGTDILGPGMLVLTMMFMTVTMRVFVFMMLVLLRMIMMLVFVLMMLVFVIMVLVFVMIVAMVMTMLRGRLPRLSGDQVHTTLGATARLVLDNFRVHGADILDPGVQDRGVEILG